MLFQTKLIENLSNFHYSARNFYKNNAFFVSILYTSAEDIESKKSSKFIFRVGKQY
jgi:hypothetical protein